MPVTKQIQLVECPRDAMQGWQHPIPTDQKIAYINKLLEVGFNTLDVGSFVSATAVPQMADTKAVLTQLNTANSKTALLAIIANVRGAQEAAGFENISYLGYPFSVSETFQQKNTNRSIKASLVELERIQNVCLMRNKKLVVYISMGFGNPYGDAYSEEMVFKWIDQLTALEVSVISLADTVGIATPDQVLAMMRYLIIQLPQQEIGIHLHATPQNWELKLAAAVEAGCTRFDGALMGIGGCPFAQNELIGNMATEQMIAYFEKKQLALPVLNKQALQTCLRLANRIFS